MKVNKFQGDFSNKKFIYLEKEHSQTLLCASSSLLPPSSLPSRYVLPRRMPLRRPPPVVRFVLASSTNPAMGAPRPSRASAGGAQPHRLACRARHRGPIMAAAAGCGSGTTRTATVCARSPAMNNKKAAPFPAGFGLVLFIYPIC
jgi:hypothetical protein